MGERRPEVKCLRAINPVLTTAGFGAPMPARVPKSSPVARSALAFETRRLAEAIVRLRAVLELQHEEVARLEARLYLETPGRQAAPRLMALKRLGTRS